MSKENTEKKVHKRENILINLLFNIFIPSIILLKLSKAQYLGPVWSLVIAISFPLIYFIHDFIQSRRWNFFSIIGFINVSLTGGFSFFQLNGFWFAVKGAVEPLIFAIATIFSVNTRYPLIKILLMNPAVINVDLINKRVAEVNGEKTFSNILVKCTYLVGTAFLVSMVTHFSLAIVVLKSQPGTPEFNEELGLMTTLGFPVNALPAMLFFGGALWYLFSELKKLTALEFNDIVIDHSESKKKEITK
jgi:hypothetical protein